MPGPFTVRRSNGKRVVVEIETAAVVAEYGSAREATADVKGRNGGQHWTVECFADGTVRSIGWGRAGSAYARFLSAATAGRTVEVYTPAGNCSHGYNVEQGSVQVVERSGKRVLRLAS